MKARFALLIGLLLLSPSQPFAAIHTNTVGTVKTLRGAASILRADQTLPARINERLFEGDRLRTGPDGSLGVILRDDTLLSIGPDSELLIDRFVFSPAEGKLGMVLRLIRGMASYISGKIAELAPESVRFETPVATVGIRGTRFAAKVMGR